MAGHESTFFLWDDRGLFLGPALGASGHAHHTREICLALDGSLDLHDEAGVRLERVKGALIEAHARHRLVERCRRVASLLVGPLTPAGRALAARLGGRTMVELPPQSVERLAPRLSDLQDAPSLEVAERLSAALVGERPRPAAGPAADARIVRALGFAALTYRDRVPVSAFASAVGLSPGRFGHLFRDHVGMPLRSYRRWLRLRAALSQVLAGDALTAAAFDAGFSDLPDFSRACRRAFGVPPSRLAHLDTFFAAAVARYPIGSE